MRKDFTPTRILVPINAAAPNPTALEYAAMVSRLSGAEIILAFASEEPGHNTESGFAVENPEQMRTRLEKDLAEFIAQHAPPDKVTRTALQIGEPADAIAAIARDQEADLIVIAPHRRSGLLRRLTTDVAGQLIREAPCAVLCLPRDETA